MYRYTNQAVQPPAPADTAGPDAFVRDSPTVLAYSALACWTFWLYAFGPSLSLLRDELHFSYTLLGLYSALWSAGAAVAGACFALAARRMSRPALLWGSALAAIVGAGLYGLG